MFSFCVVSFGISERMFLFFHLHQSLLHQRKALRVRWHLLSAFCSPRAWGSGQVLDRNKAPLFVSAAAADSKSLAVLPFAEISANRSERLTTSRTNAEWRNPKQTRITEMGIEPRKLSGMARIEEAIAFPMPDRRYPGNPWFKNLRASSPPVRRSVPWRADFEFSDRE
jgi:hypothetical protein